MSRSSIRGRGYVVLSANLMFYPFRLELGRVIGKCSTDFDLRSTSEHQSIRLCGFDVNRWSLVASKKKS